MPGGAPLRGRRGRRTPARQGMTGRHGRTASGRRHRARGAVHGRAMMASGTAGVTEGGGRGAYGVHRARHRRLAGGDRAAGRRRHRHPLPPLPAPHGADERDLRGRGRGAARALPRTPGRAPAVRRAPGVAAGHRHARQHLPGPVPGADGRAQRRRLHHVAVQHADAGGRRRTPGPGAAGRRRTGEGGHRGPDAVDQRHRARRRAVPRRPGAGRPAADPHPPGAARPAHRAGPAAAGRDPRAPGAGDAA